MKARSLLYAEDGRFQPPWRIVGFLLLFGLCGGVFALLLSRLLKPIDALIGMPHSGEELVGALAAVAATVIILRVEKRPWSYVWLDRGAARSRLLALGFALGAIPIAAISLAMVGVSLMQFVPSRPGSWITAAIQISAVLIPAALTEELISRGYIFATLGNWIGWPITIAVTSLAFGLLHIGNPNTTALPIVTVIIAGVYLAVVLLATKSLYAAWAAHFAWNWVMAVPLHVAVSGIAVPRPDYEMIETGPDWITGGGWGPEGGALAIVGMGGGMAYLYWRKKNRNNEHIG